jgi:hypothetical protein
MWEIIVMCADAKGHFKLRTLNFLNTHSTLLKKFLTKLLLQQLRFLFPS